MTAGQQSTGAGLGERIPAIEGLRAYLAWWVVAFHTLTTVWYEIPDLPMPVALLGAGGHAVTVFMILSGFVIFRLLELKREPYLPYLLRRFLRIYPVFVASGLATGTFLLVCSLIDAEALSIWPLRTLERYLVIVDHVFDNPVPHLLLNAVMLQGVPADSVLPSAGFGFNPVAWSLSLEWQFYLVAPLLFLLWRMPKFGPALLGLAIVALFAAGGFAGPHLYPSFLPMSILWFALGMFSWILYRDRHRPGTLRMLVIAAILLSAIALALCLGFVGDKPVLGANNTALPAAIWLTFLCSLIARERGSGAWSRIFSLLFESRVILALGCWSYSTYLWHRVVLWLIMIGLAEVLGTAAPWTLAWASLPFTVSVTLLLSWLSYRYIEAPPVAFARQAAARLAAARPLPAPHDRIASTLRSSQ